MKAMEMLPPSEKSIMLPIVLLAPWLNSIDFSNTHRVVNESIGDTHQIVDIDRYFKSTSALPSRHYFQELLSGDEGASKWMDLVEAHDFYIPTIQVIGVSDSAIINQIERSRTLGRGFVFRIDPITRADLDRYKHFIRETHNDDALVILDFGYRSDFITVSHETSSLVRQIVDISESIRMVITGSSFPNEFSEFDDFSGPKDICTRGVFGNVKKNYGNYEIYYGDWSSTKPRRYDGGGSAPLPRIDFPTRDNWIIARSREGQWSFKDAAERITRLPEWENRPVVWGTGMIEKTALGLPGGISTGPQAIAARVNIHLYVQNHYFDATIPTPPEGEWVDPI